MSRLEASTGLLLSLLLGAGRCVGMRASLRALSMGGTGGTGGRGLTDPSERTLALVAERVALCIPRIVDGLRTQGWAVVDGFLADPALTLGMRAEAEAFYRGGAMSVSQSTRHDPTTGRTVAYDKHNVFSMQLAGGDAYYQVSSHIGRNLRVLFIPITGRIRVPVCTSTAWVRCVRWCRRSR